MSDDGLNCDILLKKCRDVSCSLIIKITEISETESGIFALASLQLVKIHTHICIWRYADAQIRHTYC